MSAPALLAYKSVCTNFLCSEGEAHLESCSVACLRGC